mmetsp:Transcript_2002/g.4599  ORF Transcript_2002/g.4599 Transcript_2002/m.4599 type:complete len:108 (-) Transcript_2002:2457-2780(-)
MFVSDSMSSMQTELLFFQGRAYDASVSGLISPFCIFAKSDNRSLAFGFDFGPDLARCNRIDVTDRQVSSVMLSLYPDDVCDDEGTNVDDKLENSHCSTIDSFRGIAL